MDTEGDLVAVSTQIFFQQQAGKALRTEKSRTSSKI